MDDATTIGQAHSAPHRHKAPDAALFFGLSAAPLAWAAHLLLNYAIAGQQCQGSGPDFSGRSFALSTILTVDLLAAGLAIAAGYIAFGLWHRTKNEKGGDVRHLLHGGEGRTRFLAMCGMLTSLLFGLAVVIDALGSIIGPKC